MHKSLINVFRKSNKKFYDTMIYVLLIIISSIVLFPFLWGILSSFKSEKDIISYPPVLLPDPITLTHYKDVLFNTNFLLFLRNSLVVTCLTVVLTIFIASLSAYAIARFRFRGKTAVMFGVLATSMIPGISILIPLFLIINSIGLYDTHLVLVIVFSAWQIPTVMWLMRSFFESVPYELEEAAMLDGASFFTVLYRIVLPLIRPGLFAASIMIFVYVWNDFIIAMSLTVSESKQLAQVGLYRFFSDTTGIYWGRFLAYAMLVSLPIVIAFFVLSRNFIEGLVRGSVKG